MYSCTDNPTPEISKMTGSFSHIKSFTETVINSGIPLGKNGEKSNPLKIIFKMKKVETKEGGIKEEWTVEGPFSEQNKSSRQQKTKSDRRNSKENTTNSTPQSSTRTSKRITGKKRKENPTQEKEQEPPQKRQKRTKSSSITNKVSPTKSKTSPNKKSTQKKQTTNEISSISSSNGIKQPTPPRKKNPMALYKVITTMIKQLIQLDQHSIFYDRVTDDIAPNYTDVIKYPMCFLQMRDKVAKRLYKNFEAVQMDFKLIFTNAMEYNPPDTIYYNEAKRVLDEAKKLTKKYKEKLDPTEWGDSDPLFNNDAPFLIAIDPADEIRKKEEKEKEKKKKEEISVTTPKPVEKPKPSTPRPRNRSNRKRRRDEKTKQLSPIRSTPSLLSQVIPVVPDTPINTGK